MARPTANHARRDTDAPVDDQKGETSGGLETYPLDTLLIRSEPRAIADVSRRIDKKVIELDPDFERDFVWNEEVQSRLIESVLMRIPLPLDAAGRVCVHGNGTTNPHASQSTREEDVPASVRRFLQQLEPARECGCRELAPR